MTVSYDATSFFAAIFLGWRHSAIRAAWRQPFFKLVCLFYLGCCLLFHYYLPVGYGDAILAGGYFTYGMGFLGGFITFNQVFFNSKCYSRFVMNWKAAMKQWSRLNDLGLQVYAHVGSYDHFAACEIMRLMHAANAFVTLEGVLRIDRHDVVGVVMARKLLTQKEIACLTQPTMEQVNRGYQCVCWALQLLSAEVRKGALDSNLAARMDQSVCEWRQNATLPPLIGETPIPYTYYHSIATLKLGFNLLLSVRFALATVPVGPRTDGDDDAASGIPMMGDDGIQWVHVASATTVFLIMVLSLDSLFESARQLADPWGVDATDLPGGEYILRCMQGHKILFGGATDPSQPSQLGHGTAPPGKPSLFLEPLPQADVDFLKRKKTVAYTNVEGTAGKLKGVGRIILALQSSASRRREAAANRKQEVARMNGASALVAGAIKEVNHVIEEVAGVDVNHQAARMESYTGVGLVPARISPESEPPSPSDSPRMEAARRRADAVLRAHASTKAATPASSITA